LIDFRDPFRRSYRVGEVPVICQDDQALGVEVEPADGMQFRTALDQIGDERAMLRI